MPFQGVATTNALVAGTGNRVAKVVTASPGLLAFIANPAAMGNNDTGGISTAAGFDITLPAGFAGKGVGGWVPGDLVLLEVTVHDRATATQGGGPGGTVSDAAVVTLAVAGGELQLTYHNSGLQNTGALDITLHYLG